MLESPVVIGDVTAPLSVAQVDNTLDVTSAALLAHDDPGIRTTQVRVECLLSCLTQGVLGNRRRMLE